MPECWDDMVQCKVREEWLDMSYKGFKTAPAGGRVALLLWRFVLMLIRIRRSKDLLEQFQ